MICKNNRISIRGVDVENQRRMHNSCRNCKYNIHNRKIVRGGPTCEFTLIEKAKTDNAFSVEYPPFKFQMSTIYLCKFYIIYNIYTLRRMCTMTARVRSVKLPKTNLDNYDNSDVYLASTWFYCRLD